VSAAISGPWQSSRTCTPAYRSFQDNLADGKPNDWRCRAGARYLYVCEEGLVHYCSQQRGYPGVPLESYTLADIRREFDTPKPCAPYCTVGWSIGSPPWTSGAARSTPSAPSERKPQAAIDEPGVPIVDGLVWHEIHSIEEILRRRRTAAGGGRRPERTERSTVT